MRRQKGITLIALIITIIVMLILVGVTVNVAINGGLIDVTREAKFKTEVRQIQEALQVKKVTLAAINGGELPETVSITLDNLDMEQELKDNFRTKLTIEKDEDDLVLKYTSNVTEQEKQWLIELGIDASSGSLTFIDKVKQIVASESIQKAEGFVNFDDIVSQLTGRDDVEFLVYKQNALGNFIAVNSRSYEEEYNKKVVCQEILKKIEKNNYTDDTKVKDGRDILISEIYKMAVENNIINADKGNVIYSYNIKGIKESIDIIFSLSDISLYVASSEEGNLVIDDKGNVDYTDIIVMNEQEAEDMFAFTEEEVNDGVTYVSINQYKGTDVNVKIPDIICDENGNITKIITGINSFIPSLKPIYEIFEMSRERYINVATVEDIWNKVTGNTIPYPGTRGAEKDPKIKYEELLPVLANLGLTEDDVVVDNDYVPYLYLEGWNPTKMPERVKIETLRIPNTVGVIGAKAFLGQTSLKEIKYKLPLVKPIIAEEAFDGCTNLTSIRFEGGKWPFYYTMLGTGDPDPINGYETYWGAPNENIKIYDIDGEVEI